LIIIIEISTGNTQYTKCRKSKPVEWPEISPLGYCNYNRKLGDTMAGRFQHDVTQYRRDGNEGTIWVN
jgi:hypothetical protein